MEFKELNSFIDKIEKDEAKKEKELKKAKALKKAEFFNRLAETLEKCGALAGFETNPDALKKLKNSRTSQKTKFLAIKRLYN